jgi:hypothetical protein
VEALRHLPCTCPAVLDLGAACAANVAFFSRPRCRLYFADLIGEINSARGATVPGSPEDTLFEAYLPPGHQSFDLVLAWDVFNYVDRDQALDLASRLARLCRAGARLFAIVGTGDTTPGRFRNYGIVDDGRVSCRMTGERAHTGRGFAPAAFERMLEGFRVEHSFVLTDGMREYVAVRRGTPEHGDSQEGALGAHPGFSGRR